MFEARTNVVEADPRKSFLRVPRNSTIYLSPKATRTPDTNDLIDFINELENWEVTTYAEPTDYSEHLPYFQDAHQALNNSGIDAYTKLETKVQGNSIIEALERVEEQGLDAKIETGPVPNQIGGPKFYENLNYDSMTNKFHVEVSATSKEVPIEEERDREKEIRQALLGKELLLD